MPMRPLDTSVRFQLDWHLNSIGEALDSDMVAFVSPILPELDRRLRDAIEAVGDRKNSISVILDTPGGIVEVVERMVATIRSNDEYMTVIVPDRAMSAGTIFALSADQMKEERAQSIADLLNDTARWHSHARGIDVKTLRDEVGLRIDSLDDEPKLYGSIRSYFDLLKDYMDRQQLYSFVHAKGYF